MHPDPCVRLRLGEWTLADWRRSYFPGGDAFWLPALAAANRGVWRRGTLLSVAGFVISVQFDDNMLPARLGTLWPDRLVECLADRLVRDDAGRPPIRLLPKVRHPRAGPRGSCRGLALLQRRGSRPAPRVPGRLG